MACVNSSDSITLSGDEIALEKVEALLRANNVFVRKLEVDHAYHSSHMGLIERAYLAALHQVKPREPALGVRMFSSVTGKACEHSELGPEYWVKNMVSSVQFASAMQSLISHGRKRQRRAAGAGTEVFVEIGPHPALEGPSKKILDKLNIKDYAYMGPLQRGHDGLIPAIRLAGQLFSKGCAVSLGEVNCRNTTESRPR